MEQRLKVSDFYKPLNFTCAIEIQNLDNAFFAEDWLFVTTKDAPIVMQQYSLKNKVKEKEYLLPFENLGNVIILKHFLVLYFEGNQDLWVICGQKLLNFKSHFLPISSITSYAGNIITGSLDMTIRIWNPKQETLKQDPKLHALSAHTGPINYLFCISQYLLSTSTDKSLIIWKGTKIYTQKIFDSEVKLITQCSQSQQIACWHGDGTISILNSGKISKERKIQVNRIIEKSWIYKSIILQQIDDSFLQIICENKVNIAQINIGTVMAEIFLPNFVQIVQSKCIRRITLVVVRMKGLYILRF